MTLSVVMAVQNGEAHVREALDSVLAQTFSDFEFIIVDDASTDTTGRILAEYQARDSRIRVLRNERNLGPYPSANRALLEARGDVIARHDGDDMSPPHRFAVQLEALEACPHASLVTGMIDVFSARNPHKTRIIGPPTWQPALEWELLFANVVGAGAHVMFPRVVGGAPVLFPARHRYAEDFGLWCRLSRVGEVVCPAQIVYRYRQHDSSISSRHTRLQDAHFAEIRREYQARYTKSGVACETSAELARFWTGSGAGPLSRSVPEIDAALAEMRGNFLSYVEQRFGRRDRDALDAELEQVLLERLEYWLCRSIWLRDARGLMGVLSVARARRQTIDVARKAARRIAASALRRLRHGARLALRADLPAN